MSRCALVCKKIENSFSNILFYFAQIGLGLRKHWIFMNIFRFPSCSGIQSWIYQVGRKTAHSNDFIRCKQFENMVKIEEYPSYTQEIIWKERSEKAFNSPFYRINSGLDFRPLCQDSHRNHHRGLWKRSRMKRQSNEPVWHHTSCWNICIMLCISISSWTFIWR